MTSTSTPSSSTRDVRSRISSFAAQSRSSIVIDIGNVYTKVGMSGESAPRHIIRSEVAMKPYGQVQKVWDPKYINREELYLILCRFLQKIYLKCLMVNPREHRVVVVESLFCPSHFRNTLARALFSHFNVPYAAFVPSHLLCLFPIAKQSALVVDVGYRETTILPVYEGVPIFGAWQSTSCASEAMQNSVKTLLLERATVRLTETGEEKPVGALEVDELIEAAIEDIIVQTCFVRSLSTAPDKLPPAVDFPLDAKHVLVVDGYIRDHAASALFEDEAAEDQPIPVCILDALMKCSTDCRKELSENILVVGGTASLPGFNYRVKECLEQLVSTQYHSTLAPLSFKFHDPPSFSNSTAWVGGSIFGASEAAVLERAISRDKFKDERQLPDWMSTDPDQREKLRPVPIRKLLPSAPGSFTRSSASTKS